MKATLFLSAVFAGAMLLAADPAVNLVFKQDFEKGADQFVKAPAGVKFFSKTKPALVDGRVKGTKAVHFDETSKECIIRGMKMPIPGNISVWLKTDDKVGKGVYRRYIGTSYHNTGYFGYQEYTHYSLLFVHAFNKKNKNIGTKNMPLGKWNHLSINLKDKYAEIYHNGVLIQKSDLPESISKVVGEIIYGSKGYAMDSLEIYNRVLTAEEIKALAK